MYKLTESILIVSESCAKRCGLDPLIDSRFAGIARGVGTGKILGRVHMAQLQLSDQYLPCSFTVLEGDFGQDMLLGLDMLKRHQIVIDLGANCLKVHNRSIGFLPESEIPKHNQ